MKHTNTIKRLVRETLEQKYTCAKDAWAVMMEDLSEDIKKPVVLDDAGNYNVCECEPHHISIRPVTQDIFDVQAFKDGADRVKKLYMKYEDVCKFVKEYLSSEDMNYVDTAFSRNVENSKDKESKSKEKVEQNTVNPQNDYAFSKRDKVESMNDEIDDPTKPMREVGKFDRLSDYKSEKPSYTPPKLPTALKKLVVKYTKGGKVKKRY